jgi:hypothetical protein
LRAAVTPDEKKELQARAEACASTLSQWSRRVLLADARAERHTPLEDVAALAAASILTQLNKQQKGTIT